MTSRTLRLVVLLAGLLAACAPQLPPPPVGPVIGFFRAEPATVAAGSPSTLTWTVTGAAELRLNPGNLDVGGTTSYSVAPAATTSYTLSATNAAGTTTATATVTVTTEGTTVSEPVRAADGGVVATGGATLTIPAGALNQDTLVTLTVGAPTAGNAENPLQPAGPRVDVDLGGATLTAAAALDVPYSPSADVHYVFTEETADLPADAMPGTRVHRVQQPGTGMDVQQAGTTLKLEVERAGAFGVQAIARLDPTLIAQQEGAGSSLQVPFYWQAGWPWCSPTSTSMVLNYFQPLPGLDNSPEIPGGRVSNYYLASLLDQDATSGSWVGSFMEAARVPTDLYQWLVWDADLIPSDPFTAYVTLATTGVFGLAPRRPVLTTSDKTAHAFVITGVTGDGAFINDSNARWDGTHPSLTWAQFREQNQIGTSKTELGTLFIRGTPRPEAERRGSLELAPPTAEDMSRTIRFENPSGITIANWMWDANPFPYGYFFKDATASSYWPIDNVFGHVLPRSSGLEAGFNVVNITDVARNYDVVARVYLDGAFKLERSVLGMAVGAYDRERVDLDFGNLAAVVGPLGAPVTGRLEINLTQSGVVQDVKAISFRLGPDPSDPPTLTVDRPSYGVTTLTNVPLTFEGRAWDRYHFPTGEVPASRLSWWQGGTKLADGRTVNRGFATPGQYTLTLRGTSEYGTVATKDILVNVIDPVRNPGEVVIDYPTNTTFGYANFFDIDLVGHATYADGTPVPDDRLYWSYSDGFIGTGTHQVVRLHGYCTGAIYTITLTARKADGSPIGTREITVKIYAPPC